MKAIVPYHPGWKIAFEEIKTVLQAQLDNAGLESNIQHVGSTAVPGLYAKPVLDIDIIIEDRDLLTDFTAVLERLGYQFMGDQGIPERFAFRQVNDLVPAGAQGNSYMKHHLYVCYADSLALRNHLLFRDALNRDDALREQYSALKRSLTEEGKTISNTYTADKTAFIVAVLAAAGLDKSDLDAIVTANT